MTLSKLATPNQTPTNMVLVLHSGQTWSPHWLLPPLPIANGLKQGSKEYSQAIRKGILLHGEHFAKLTNQSKQAYLWSTGGKCWLCIIPQGQVGEVGPFCVALFYKTKGNHKESQKDYYCWWGSLPERCPFGGSCSKQQSCRCIELDEWELQNFAPTVGLKLW